MFAWQSLLHRLSLVKMNGNMKKIKHYVYAGIFLAGIAISGSALRNGKVKQDAVEPQAPPVAYLDVRTESEWLAGHLDGAVHLDLQEIQKGALPDLPKDSVVKIYCRSGKRAETAKGILGNSGFSKIENAGGFEGLVSAGKKSCTGPLASCP